MGLAGQTQALEFTCCEVTLNSKTREAETRFRPELMREKLTSCSKETPRVKVKPPAGSEPLCEVFL